MKLDDLSYICRKLDTLNYSFDERRILLIGSEGFLGKLFKEYFRHLNIVLDCGLKVYCLDNYILGQSGQLDNETFSHFNLDITKSENVNLLPPGIDYIINLAGIASPKIYKKYPVLVSDIGYLGTKNMLEYMKINKSVEAYLGCSSSEVYSDPEDKYIPTQETAPIKINLYSDRTAYDSSKIIVEALCHAYHVEFGLNTKVVRPFNVFGYQANDGRVIPNYISKVLKGEKLQIYGDGSETRAFCWFSDFLIGAIKILLCGDNQAYNIGNQYNGEISMLDLARKVEKLHGGTDLVEHIEPPECYKVQPKRRCPDISRARKDLLFQPEISIDEGLEKLYNWAKDNYK